LSKSKTYVVCWDEVLDNTVQIENELLSGNFSYTIINKSRLKTNNAAWTPAKNTRYYGHFLTALDDFVASQDHSIFVFNAGDGRWQKMAEYTARIESLFETIPSMGALSPNQTNDPFTGTGSFIAKSTLDPGLALSTVTNGIFIALSRELAEIVHRYMIWALKNNIDFYSMTSGWGLDYVYCAASVYLNRYVYKDTTILMQHPTGSGYNYEVANSESEAITKAFAVFWEQEGKDGDMIRRIFDMFLAKVHKKNTYHLTPKELFVNAKSELIF
jgi:hypothetical protein